MKSTKTTNKPKSLSLVSIKMVREQEIPYNESITRPATAARLLHPFFKDMDREVFYVLSLSSRKEPLSLNLVSMGTLKSTLVSPANVFKPAILSNANTIVIAHNHPSGHAMPSRADEDFTKRVKEVGKMLGIELDDHLILYGDSPDQFVSLREMNLF